MKRSHVLFDVVVLAVYLLAALGVIVTHHDALPGAFRDIF